MKVFISYSNRNRDLVETLAKDLDSAVSMISPDPDNKVWFDEQLVGGQDWWNTILDHLRNCDIFVFALSPHSIKSDACQRELRYATDLKKRILPIWITSDISAMDMPELLQARQWINYAQQDKAAFQGLITAIRQLPAAQTLPDPLPTPPAMPLSPLAEISHQLANDKLDRDQQNEIVSRLKDFMAQPEQAKDAYQLLLRLKQHPDLRRSVAEDIDDLLRDLPASVTSGQAPAPTRRPPSQLDPVPAAQIAATYSVSKTVSVPSPAKPAKASRRLFGVNGLTIGLVIGFLGGIVYAQSAQVCGVDYYGNYVCNNAFDVEYLIGSIIVWGALGWGIDWLWRRFVKKNNASSS